MTALGGKLPLAHQPQWVIRITSDKVINLAVHSQQRLDEIARQLNGRLRKRLGYKTPAERFEACVAMTD